MIDRLPSTISLIRRDGTPIARARPFCVRSIGSMNSGREPSWSGVGDLPGGGRRVRRGRDLLSSRRSRCAIADRCGCRNLRSHWARPSPSQFHYPRRGSDYLNTALLLDEAYFGLLRLGQYRQMYWSPWSWSTSTARRMASARPWSGIQPLGQYLTHLIVPSAPEPNRYQFASPTLAFVLIAKSFTADTNSSRFMAY